MDLLANLFNKNVELKTVRVPAAEVGGLLNLHTEDDDYNELVPPHEGDDNSPTAYTEEYCRKEKEMYEQYCKDAKKTNNFSSVDDNDGVDGVSTTNCTVDLNAFRQEEFMEIYSRYNFNNQHVEELPIDLYREEILTLVDINQVVIIEGPTGCGKTTRVPQFILDDCRSKSLPCKIVVTQPRRIAAISVARRVCEERNWAIGGICGYKVGLESMLSNDTLLSYVTTGVLLQKLIKQKSLHEFTHIIIDEVHERNQDMDFLLLVIRRFVNIYSSNTKIILMSATFDCEQFAKYFMQYTNTIKSLPAPMLKVQKRSKYRTQTFFLDHVKVLGNIPDFSISEPTISNDVYTIFLKLMRALDKLDTSNPVTNERIIGNVLVFLPGIYEIEEAHKRLTESNYLFKGDSCPQWQILPLHSSITIEEQRKVFQPPPKGMRKIILSTNIAESSITVPDILYVIDFCLIKTLILDTHTQYQSLKLQWASHDNCIQRAGRVGRVADGRVYYLVPTRFYNEFLPKNIVPEMLRAPLSQTVLLAKLLELNEPPKAILALAINPPNLSNIDNTVLLLKEIGALYMTCNGKRVASDGDLTFLGYVMAHLPLAVNLSKFIILGYMFNCLEECIIMATGCTLNIFKCPFKEHLKAYCNLLQWADGSCSDLIAYLHLYRVWQNQRRMHTNAKIEKEWASKNFISQRSLVEWQLLVREVKDRLENLQITQPEGVGRYVLDAMELPTIIKVVICGAFYPNYCSRSSDGGQVDEREAVKILGGRDPNNTVYFTGFDTNQPGPLYVKEIKKLLSDCGNMHVSFDNSSKVYVEFLNQNPIQPVEVHGRSFLTTMPGKIQVEVYRAVKLRQISYIHSIRALNVDNAWNFAKTFGIDKSLSSSDLSLQQSAPSNTSEDLSEILDSDPPILPGLDVEFISIVVSMIIDAGHFWVHNTDHYTLHTLKMLNKALNSTQLARVNPQSVIVGGTYAALYQNEYYRAKIVTLAPFTRQNNIVAQILFIDYGNSATVKLEELRALPDHKVTLKPALAMECFLSEIQPSVVLDSRELWTQNAKREMELRLFNKVVFGKVYSVVNGIIRLELYERSLNDAQSYTFDNSINAYLIKRGLAQPAEESFLSKENHLKRQELIANPEKRAFLMKEHSEITSRVSMQDIDLPNDVPLKNLIMLKGPYSPLEMNIYSVVNSGSAKKITIEGNSVNSILLDTDPQDPHERLVVAAAIGQQATGNGLTLRHTTVMPNIHGFVALMSLLFCPQMEPKPMANGSRIGAILFGLGARDDSHQPLYGAHDICLHLDTDITASDINEINTLRHCMNISVETMKANYQQTLTTATMAECQKQLISRLFKLLKARRKSVDRAYIKNANVWGKTLYDGDVLKPSEGDRLMKTEVWPLHWTIRTKSEDEQSKTITSHLIDLEEFAMRRKMVNEITCQLCNETVFSPNQLRVHLMSKIHIDNVTVQKQMHT